MSAKKPSPRPSPAASASAGSGRSGLPAHSFSLSGWLGPASPLLFVWAFKTAEAVMLSWRAIFKKDSACPILNVFWEGVGVVGMVLGPSGARR